jgi:hypothetical protein
MTTTITKLFYNGTCLEVMGGRIGRLEVEEKAKLSLERNIQIHTLAEIKQICLKDLEELEADLFAHFGDNEFDVKDAMKHWGANSIVNYCRWCFGIIILLKLKVIKNDNKNGWLEINAPTEVFKMMNLRTYTPSKLFNTCECCGNKGTLKKCGSCKKVYYCGAGCQKSHWKTHKSNCC